MLPPLDLITYWKFWGILPSAFLNDHDADFPILIIRIIPLLPTKSWLYDTATSIWKLLQLIKFQKLTSKY